MGVGKEKRRHKNKYGLVILALLKVVPTIEDYVILLIIGTHGEDERETLKTATLAIPPLDQCPSGWCSRVTEDRLLFCQRVYCSTDAFHHIE